jgi:hypothetical protein
VLSGPAHAHFSLAAGAKTGQTQTHQRPFAGHPEDSDE